MSSSLADARGRKFKPLRAPVRVVSLVPSLTELLFDLGLREEEVVGRTRFCVHPAGRVENVPVVGGTKSINVAEVLALQPDLVIAGREENPKEAIEKIEDAESPPRVFVTNPESLDEALDMIRDIGVLIGRRGDAQKIAERIDGLRSRLDPPSRGTALYLIWMKPFMTVAPGTFIHDMMRLAGYRNAIAPSHMEGHRSGSRIAARYPEITVADIAAIGPDSILLSSEPFPFEEEHVGLLRQQLAAIDAGYAGRASIRVVNGEHFSWYGSRLMTALEAFERELSGIS